MTFGPGSLLWEAFGDRRGYLVAPREGLLQLMYPDLGKGVEQHSAFYDEPWERLFRSVPQIQGVIYDGPNAQQTADSIREFHRGIKGTHEDGLRYHALDPATYFWAHATFLDAYYCTTDLFEKQSLTYRQRAAIYREGVEWFRMYGVSMRAVPATYDDFLDYWNHTLEHVLEPTPSATKLVETMRDPSAMPQPWFPRPLWRAMSVLGRRPVFKIVTGTLPPVVREKFDLPWTWLDQRQFDAFRRSVAYSWPALPYPLRIMPRARAGYRREGRIGIDVALDRAERFEPADGGRCHIPASLPVDK